MKFKNIFLAILAVLIVTACTDKFLDSTPKSFISPVNFYQNKEEALSSLIAAYDYIGSGHVGNYGFHQDPAYTDILTDDVLSIQLGIPYNKYQSITPGDGILRDGYVHQVRALNAFTTTIVNVGNMNESQITNKDKNMIVSEAKYLRAYRYFYLVRQYGGMPLYTKVVENLETAVIPRSTVDETYELIIKDLEEAIPHLAEVNELPKGRVTKAAAQGLLSLVYLTRQQWEKAAEMAKEVIDNPNYGLMDNYKDIFSEENENNKEVIFDIQYTNNDVVWVGEVAHAGWYLARELGRGWNGANTLSPDLVESFEPGDVRTELIKSEIEKDNGSIIKFRDAPFSIKHWSKGLINGSNGDAFNRFGLNFIVMRYAEVLLIYAEALNELERTSEALPYLNRVRQRAHLADLPSGMSQEDFRLAVWKERRHELFDERVRRFDLVRQGRLLERQKAAVPDTQIKEHHILLPIPQEAIDRNPVLTQNPGY